jgi:AraC-like DNA-binding protein
LRLHRAAIDLLDRELSIERAAHRAGDASQAAFTRAFRVEYGRPPARYRGARRVAEPDQERNPTIGWAQLVTTALVARGESPQRRIEAGEALARRNTK